MILFGKKKTVTLIGNQKDGGEKLINPGRGFLRVYPFKLEEPFDEEVLSTSVVKEETLALVEISLAAYKDTNIDEGGLNHLHHILIFFRRRHLDVILRVSYDMEGETVTYEPTTLNQILRHMDQVMDVVAGYKNEIFLVQGLFVGRWGEMHSSRYTTDETLVKLYRRFRMSKAGDLTLAVRTPDQLRLLSSENEILKEDEPFLTNLNRIALFDDAMLSDDTDMGTFGLATKEDDMLYIAKRCQKYPVGGEAITGEEVYTAKDVIHELRTMGVNYLNSQYDKRQLDNWKEASYGGTDLYTFVDNHLGYRLLISEINWDKKQELLSIVVENRGFGALTETTDFTCEITRKIKKDLTLPENIDLTGEEVYDYKMEQKLKYRLSHGVLAGGSSVNIEMPLQELPKGQYLLSVELTRNKDGRKIYFANEKPELIERVPMVQS